MSEIYASKISREALDVFMIYKGQGEYFDLSTKPITRASFTLGDIEMKDYGYRIMDTCVSCGNCYRICPMEAIIKL